VISDQRQGCASVPTRHDGAPGDFPPHRKGRARSPGSHRGAHGACSAVWQRSAAPCAPPLLQAKNQHRSGAPRASSSAGLTSHRSRCCKAPGEDHPATGPVTRPGENVASTPTTHCHLLASQNHALLHTRCSRPAPGSSLARARVDGDQIPSFYHPRAGAALAWSRAREVGDDVEALPTWRAGLEGGALI
jgi:hypothetical protein